MSKGVLQPDMWGVTPSDRWDWAGLRRDIAANGVRNSLLVAPMPTASTSQVGVASGYDTPELRVFMACLVWGVRSLHCWWRPKLAQSCTLSSASRLSSLASHAYYLRIHSAPRFREQRARSAPPPSHPASLTPQPTTDPPAHPIPCLRSWATTSASSPTPPTSTSAAFCRVSRRHRRPGRPGEERGCGLGWLGG